MTIQATGLCLLLAIALSSPVEQGIILGSVINMEQGQVRTSQGGDNNARWLLEERRCLKGAKMVTWHNFQEGNARAGD